VLDESVKLKEGNMTLPSDGRIKKLCENTLLSWDNISPLANNYKVANGSPYLQENFKYILREYRTLHADPSAAVVWGSEYLWQAIKTFRPSSSIVRKRRRRKGSFKTIRFGLL
jgi:hypothetical protein